MTSNEQPKGEIIEGEILSQHEGPSNDPNALKIGFTADGEPLVDVNSGDPEGIDVTPFLIPENDPRIKDIPKSHKGQTTVWIIIVAALILVSIGAFLYFSANRTDTVDTPDNPTGGQANDGVTAGEVTQIKLFYYALEDNGKRGKQIGCGDSVVFITKEIPATKAPLTAALNTLLADKRMDVEEGLKNALYQSTLTLESASVVGGKATIRIKGTTQLGGVCDEPRFGAQIEQTVFQFPSVTSAEIYINGELLKDFLSQKA